MTSKQIDAIYPSYHLGKGSFGTGNLDTVAVDPALVATLAPGSLGIQVAQLLRNAPFTLVRLMPDWKVSLKQAFVFSQVTIGKRLVPIGNLLTNESRERCDDQVESNYYRSFDT